MTDNELKLDAIKHIKEHGNLAAWGDNMLVIWDMYVRLEAEMIILYDKDERIWRVINDV